MFQVYKTTNLLNGKIYVGVHSLKQDNYLGSGGDRNGGGLAGAIKKYGRENFIRETLIECDTIEEAYELEKFIVTSAFVARPDTYNLVPGGKIPPSNTEKQRGVPLKEEHKRKISVSRKGKHSGSDHWSKQDGSESSREKIAIAVGLRSKGKKYALGVNTNKRWFKKPEDGMQCFTYECPSGFVPGRIYKRNK